MRIGLLVVVGATAAAHAEPATREQFEACKARRSELSVEAMKIPTAAARAEAFAAMPSCERHDDGTFAVTVAAPRPVDTTPFVPRAELAVRVGASASTILSNEVQPGGFGPYVEVEAGYQLRRHLELAAMVGYASFRDPAAFDILTGRVVDVREASFDAAARVTARYGAVSFGAGLGLEYERYPNASFATTLPLLEVHVGYTFARTRVLRAQAFATLTDGNTLFAAGFHGDLVSARLGVGVQL
jgi:hypothetical protein